MLWGLVLSSDVKIPSTALQLETFAKGLGKGNRSCIIQGDLG